MQYKQLTKDYAVMGQIWPEQVAELGQAGFRSVICNRPDGEAGDQPDCEEIEAAVKAAGLAFRYIPIVPGRAGPDEVMQTVRAMGELPGPILAFCRSGARSEAMFNAAHAVRQQG